MAMGLLESVPQFKLRAPFRPPRHSKKVKFKSNVTNHQEVLKKNYGKGLRLGAGV